MDAFVGSAKMLLQGRRIGSRSLFLRLEPGALRLPSDLPLHHRSNCRYSRKVSAISELSSGRKMCAIGDGDWQSESRCRAARRSGAEHSVVVALLFVPGPPEGKPLRMIDRSEFPEGTSILEHAPALVTAKMPALSAITLSSGAQVG